MVSFRPGRRGQNLSSISNVLQKSSNSNWLSVEWMVFMAKDIVYTKEEKQQTFLVCIRWIRRRRS